MEIAVELAKKQATLIHLLIEISGALVTQCQEYNVPPPAGDLAMKAQLAEQLHQECRRLYFQMKEEVEVT